MNKQQSNNIDIRDIKPDPKWDEDTKATHYVLCLMKSMEEYLKKIKKVKRV